MSTGAAATVAASDAAVPAPTAASRRWPGRTGADLVAALVCLGLAVLAQQTLPSLPAYDPFSWIVWGHELAHHVVGPHLPFVIHGGPSWKPLPVLFTTIFGFFGSHALPLWIVFARAAGLYALWLAAMVGARLGASERWSLAAPLAGLLSALAVISMLFWIHYMFRATSEPLTVTAALLWLDWHLRGHRLLALAAGTALALMRPESSAFVILYALWALWRGPGVVRRIVPVALLALIPAAWVVPPWIAEHKPLMSSNQARDFTGNRGHDLATIALQRADYVLVWPVIAGALVMVLIALWRRERLIVGLGLVCLAYVGIVEVMTIHHYPGLPRFLLPAGAIACVLAGAGVARLGALAGGGARSALVAAACIAVAVPWTSGRIARFGLERRQANVAVQSYDALVVAARRAGGVPRMWPCGRGSVVAVNHTVQPSLAWALDIPLDRVHPVTDRTASVHHPSLALFARRNPEVGGAPRHLGPGLHVRHLFRERMWRVERITRHHDAAIDACVGT